MYHQAKRLPRAQALAQIMQTVSKYGAADAEAQEPALKPQGLSRAAVASICFAAALSGAAVASVARVRTRAYVTDLAAVSYTMGASELCGELGKCEEPERCYQKVKDGETKYKCAEGSPGGKWIVNDSARSKKKPGPDSLSGGGGDKPDEVPPCYFVFEPVCNTEGNWHSNDCVATKQKKKTISSEHVFDNGKCVKR